MDLALNSLQRLICHKILITNQLYTLFLYTTKVEMLRVREQRWSDYTRLRQIYSQGLASLTEGWYMAGTQPGGRRHHLTDVSPLSSADSNWLTDWQTPQSKTPSLYFLDANTYFSRHNFCDSFPMSLVYLKTQVQHRVLKSTTKMLSKVNK